MFYSVFKNQLMGLLHNALKKKKFEGKPRVSTLRYTHWACSEASGFNCRTLFFGSWISSVKHNKIY